jgi:hypothetical protein
MEEIGVSGVWIPTVGLGRNESTGDFKLIRYGAKEDSGMSFCVGNIISVKGEVMARDGLRIVLGGLAFYQVWPAKTKLESEIGVMDSRSLSAFVRMHKFVDILKRDERSLCISPSHREGRSWKGIKSYIEEEIPVRTATSEKEFYETLMKAFDLAT